MRYFIAPLLLVLCLPVACRDNASADANDSVNAMSAPLAAPVVANVTAAAEDDDGLRDTPEAYAVSLQGEWDLWQDVEGGRVCPITLSATPLIGGYAVRADAKCVAQLPLEGEVYAWFIADNEQLVLADATRKALARMVPNQDGTFYLDRSGTGFESVVLSRKQTSANN